MNKFLIITLLVLLFFSCKEEEYWEKESENGYGELSPIIDELRADPDYSQFVSLLEKAGIDELLVKGTVYSVFAPNNQAIEAYNMENADNTVDKMDSTQVKEFVEYHIIFGIYYQYDFNKRFRVANENRFPTRVYRKDFNDRKMLTIFPNYFFDGGNKYNYSVSYEEAYGQKIELTDSVFCVEDAKVIKDKMDISCSNGVIHGINKVLVPKKNVFETLRDNDDFSIFFSFIDRYDTLIPVYEGSEFSHYDMQFWYTDEDNVKTQITGWNYNLEEESNTLFVPTNEVINAYFAPYLESIEGNNVKNLPDDIVIQLLKYNTTHRFYAQPLFKEDLFFPIFTSLGASFSNADEYIENQPIIASNGFIYPVSKLAAPRLLSSVTGQILLDPQFKTLRYLLEETGLMSYLSNLGYASNEVLFGERIWYPQSWTIIAPSEQVFRDSLQTSVYEMSLNSKRSLMNYLIIRDTIFLDEPVDFTFDKGTFTSDFGDGYYKTKFGTYMRKEDNTVYSSIYTDSTAQIIDKAVGSNGVIYIVDDILFNFPTNYTLFNQMNNYRSEFSLIFDEIGTGRYPELKDELVDTRAELTFFVPSNLALKAYDEIAEADPELKTWEEMDFPERELFMRNHLFRRRLIIEDNATWDLYSSVGNKVSIYEDRGQLRIKGESSKVPAAAFRVINKQSSNGVLNVIDQVILP